ncbi:hypothetical protein ACIGW3_09880 [Streptomyces sp. NPDC053499]|uniref:hypothetical protein n=1 Tax=Streptomyces sp. NPDC053499 TaxID=3365707 RepID=UPI0037CF87E8
MTQLTPARVHRCRDCDGFPTVHIDTGARHRDGTRRTTPVTCRACNGTGTVLVHPSSSASVGR